MISGGLVLCDYPPLCIPYFNTTFKSSYNLAITSSFSAFEQMGAAASKGYTRANDKPKNLRRTVRLLEKEVMELRSKKQGQAIAHEDRVMLFTAKEAGWKRERKVWTEEMDEMRKQLDEKDEKIRRLEEELLIMDGNGGKEWYLLEVGVLLEQMQEEQALRQEAVLKWKGLYLAIKSELDDLIQRTCQGEWTSLGEEVEKLQRKLKAREERVAYLRSRLVMKEKEAVEKQREVDILRQSLRIMSDKKQAQTSHSFSGSLHCGKSYQNEDRKDVHNGEILHCLSTS